jgi:hypothetical protein
MEHRLSINRELEMLRTKFALAEKSSFTDQ